MHRQPHARTLQPQSDRQLSRSLYGRPHAWPTVPPFARRCDLQASGSLLDISPGIPGKAFFWHRALAPVRQSALLQPNTSFIPLGGLSYHLHYRSDLLASAGLPVPATWPELLAAAEALNSSTTGTWGFCHVSVTGQGKRGAGKGARRVGVEEPSVVPDGGASHGHGPCKPVPSHSVHVRVRARVLLQAASETASSWRPYGCRTSRRGG